MLFEKEYIIGIYIEPTSFEYQFSKTHTAL